MPAIKRETISEGRKTTKSTKLLEMQASYFNVENLPRREFQSRHFQKKKLIKQKMQKILENQSRNQQYPDDARTKNYGNASLSFGSGSEKSASYFANIHNKNFQAMRQAKVPKLFHLKKNTTIVSEEPKILVENKSRLHQQKNIPKIKS